MMGGLVCPLTIAQGLGAFGAIPSEDVTAGGGLVKDDESPHSPEHVLSLGRGTLVGRITIRPSWEKGDLAPFLLASL